MLIGWEWKTIVGREWWEDLVHLSHRWFIELVRVCILILDEFVFKLWCICDKKETKRKIENRKTMEWWRNSVLKGKLRFQYKRAHMCACLGLCERVWYFSPFSFSNTLVWLKWHEASEAHFLRDTILIVVGCHAYLNGEKREIPSFDLKKIEMELLLWEKKHQF